MPLCQRKQFYYKVQRSLYMRCLNKSTNSECDGPYHSHGVLADPPAQPPPSLNGPRPPPPRKPPPPPRPLDPVLDSLAPPVPARRGETKDTMVSRDQMVDISVYQLGDRIDELCHSPNGFKQEYMVSYGISHADVMTWKYSVDRQGGGIMAW